MTHAGASLVRIAMVVVGCLGAGLASAQSFPSKPIRMIASAPGGAGDVVSRLISPLVGQSLGQPVVIENRGNTTGDVVAVAPPDGYTLLSDSFGFYLSPLLEKRTYDATRDFTVITLLTRSPNLLVVHPGVAANSVKELIALAKSKPGELNFGSAGQGSTPHLAGELFKSMTGVDMVHVPYGGAAQAVQDLIGNRIQVYIGSLPSVLPNVKAGKLRALAVTTATASVLAPGLAPVSELGLPGYRVETLQGLWAPAKTPPAVIATLNQEFVRALNQPEIREKLLAVGSEAAPGTPQETDALLKAEYAKWSKLIKDIGIQAN